MADTSGSMALNQGSTLGVPESAPSLPQNRSEKKGRPYVSHFEVMRDAACNGDVDTVRALIPVCNPKQFNSIFLLTAAREGHLDTVRLLIPVSDPKADNSAALQWAARNGHRDVVRALIPVSDPKAKDSEALRQAAWHGHHHLVRDLIPVSDPKAGGIDSALCWAALLGHLSVVRQLIPVSDPQANDSEPLRIAASTGHHRIVTELVPVSNAASVFRSLIATAQLDIRRAAGSTRIEFSLRAVDALVPHVNEDERKQALAGLPSMAFASMPRLKAWREAQGLRAGLHQMMPTGATQPQPRRAL